MIPAISSWVHRQTENLSASDSNTSAASFPERAFRLEYTAEFRPFILESDPTSTLTEIIDLVILQR